MRHVSRTHRVALDWLFDRINLDPKIPIRHIDTKHQIADILTKGNFTRDEWNNLLHLFYVREEKWTIVYRVDDGKGSKTECAIILCTAPVLVDLTTKSAKKLVVEPPAIHFVSYDSPFTALEFAR